MVGVASRCEWWGVAIRGLGRRRGGKLSIPGPLRFRSCLRNHPAPTRQDLPPLSCAGCLGPSFPAPFFPRPLPHPHLPGGGGGRGGPERKGQRKGTGGGGELPRGSDSPQPQPPHPHDLHRREPRGEGERGAEELAVC